MDKIVIYHNARCGKSRQCLQLLQAKGIEPEIKEYLKNPPTELELKEVIKKLGIPAKSLIRTKESVFLEHFSDKNLSDEAWIKIMVEHPILIERPIVIKGNKAQIGRPPENILSILE